MTDEEIVRAYFASKNMRRVAKELGVSVSRVRRALLLLCGPLYGSPGLCRLYIYMKGRCFATAGEVSKGLGVSVHDVYYLFSQIAGVDVGLIPVTVVVKSRRFIYIVKATEECWRAFHEHVEAMGYRAWSGG